MLMPSMITSSKCLPALRLPFSIGGAPVARLMEIQESYERQQLGVQPVLSHRRSLRYPCQNDDTLRALAVLTVVSANGADKHGRGSLVRQSLGMAGLSCADIPATERLDVLSVPIFIKHLSRGFQSYCARVSDCIDRSKK